MPEAPATPPPPPAASRTPLSACIIAFNEADRIGDCLASLAFCDEIVVVDSGSVDGTRELCERLGARVLQRLFDGFRSQKRFAVEQCRHDWVLCLDADEHVDERLREAIEAARAAGFTPAPGYRFPPLPASSTRFLRPGTAPPALVLPLFHPPPRRLRA